MKVVNIFGEFSGRMNGVVWSRNRGGAYIRSYVTPLNPSSEKQMRQRYFFGKSAQRFTLLGDDQRAAWKNYAENVFVPLVGTGNGTHINAYVSLLTTIEVYNQAMNATDVTPIFAKSPLDPPEAPPAYPAGGVLYLDGNPIYANIHGANINSSQLEITIKLSSLVSLENKALKAGSDGVALLAVYRSDWARGDYKKNKFSYLLGVTPKLQNVTSSFNDIRLTVPFAYPIEGNRAALTLVLADEFGQQTPIDEFELVL